MINEILKIVDARIAKENKLTLNEILKIIDTGLVEEDKYHAIIRWYLYNSTPNNWFGNIGIDGTGEIYCFTENYNSENAVEHKFYVKNEYYMEMNNPPRRMYKKIEEF